MEEIIKSITEAEAKAEQIKAAAKLRAEEISAAAEKRAAEIYKNSEAELKTLREVKLRAAEAEAENRYNKEIAEKTAEAEKYAEGLIADTEKQVNEIVGRILGGNG